MNLAWQMIEDVSPSNAYMQAVAVCSTQLLNTAGSTPGKAKREHGQMMFSLSDHHC